MTKIDKRPKRTMKFQRIERSLKRKLNFKHREISITAIVSLLEKRANSLTNSRKEYEPIYQNAQNPDKREAYGDLINQMIAKEQEIKDLIRFLTNKPSINYR